jgi:hypothetical protein
LPTPVPRPARRRPTPAPVGLGSAVGRLGRPLPGPVASRLTRTFNTDLSGVRVHEGARQAQALGARAYALGSDIHLAPGERPTDVPLMAHEVAHVMQQGGLPTAIQAFTPGGRDLYESEANMAALAAMRGDTFAVREQTLPRVQTGAALDWVADKANLVPGFRMFTIVLGVNPINMRSVDRSAANILRAVVELLGPVGIVMSNVLDRYGVFEKAGAYVEGQLKSLGLTAAGIKGSIDRFIDATSWGDILTDPDGVWDRGKKILTEPIDKIIRFVGGLISAIADIVKDVILKPLAALAEGTRAYPLLKAVLGKDPITGEEVPPTADALIGGFMTLIGQEEVYENIKKGNAVERAITWFKGTMQGLVSRLSQIPQLFVAALKAIEIGDLLDLPGLFGKLKKVFGDFVSDFFDWAGKQVMGLLEIIFSVVAPGAMPYIRKAQAAFKKIIQDPIAFIGNLVRAGVQGFTQFAKNFLTHLKKALIDWLTGSLSGANVYIPQALNLREIVKFVLSVLGLTWANIRVKLVKAVGETAVSVLEKTFDIVVTLVREGPAAAWEKIKESLTNLRDMVMDQVMSFVRDKIVQAAVTKLLTSLNPAGAFIQAIIAIYNAIMFVVEKLKQIARVAASIIDSLSAIASGAIGPAAGKVEQTLGGMLTLVISFLARQVGLHKVSDKVVEIINKLRAPIDKALDKVVAWIVAMAKKLGKLLGVGGGPQRDVDRPVRFAGESHVVRARIDGSRLVVQMSSGGFKPVDTELAHVKKHILDDYLGGTGDKAAELTRRLSAISRKKDAWTTRFNAVPPDRQQAVINDGMTELVEMFKQLNTWLESTIGPWATVRVGDTVRYTEGGKASFATVTEIMSRDGGGLGAKAVPVAEAPQGRRLSRSQATSAQSIGLILAPSQRVLQYSTYGTRWTKHSGDASLLPGSRAQPFPLDWPKPWWNAYPVLYFGGKRPPTPQATLRALAATDPTIHAFPPAGGSLGGVTIGIQGQYRLASGSIIGPLSGSASTGGGGKLIRILQPYGYIADADGLEVDHVHDIQFGGADAISNLWPLQQSINSAAGAKLGSATVTVPGTGAKVAIADLKRVGGVDFWFQLK